jgi:hypothetical protein
MQDAGNKTAKMKKEMKNNNLAPGRSSNAERRVIRLMPFVLVYFCFVIACYILHMLVKLFAK